MKKKKTICALGCGHLVSGGDRHAKFHCPPKAGRRAGRRDAARARGFAGIVAESSLPARGAVVAGTGKPRGDGAKGGKAKTPAAAPAPAAA